MLVPKISMILFYTSPKIIKLACVYYNTQLSNWKQVFKKNAVSIVRGNRIEALWFYDMFLFIDLSLPVYLEMLYIRIIIIIIIILFSCAQEPNAKLKFSCQEKTYR